MWSKFFEAFLETLWMIVCPGFLATVLGGALGLGLFILRPDNLLKTGVHPVV
jgi:ABC-type methionine transport system permease subunit